MNTEIQTCSVCLQLKEINEFCETDCHHKFCKDCLDKWFNAKKLSCPLCRKNIEYFQYQGNIHRIVCIIQKEQPLPQLNPSSYVIMTKKMYYIMNIVTSLSVFSSLLTGFLITKCNEFGAWI